MEGRNSKTEIDANKSFGPGTCCGMERGKNVERTAEIGGERLHSWRTGFKLKGGGVGGGAGSFVSSLLHGESNERVRYRVI